VRYVLVYPYSGFRDRWWGTEGQNGEGGDADVDAVARTSRRVCEAYSRGLVELALEGNHGEVRVFVHRSRREDGVIPVDAYLDWSGGFEMAHVGVPAGAAGWPEQRRARLLLEGMHAVMTRFGQARGWSQQDLDRLRETCLDSGLDLTWRSSWKAAPGRHSEACVDAWLHDDGFSRVRILLRDRATGEVTGCSQVVEGPVGEAGLKRAARSLRWRDREVVEVVLPTFLGNRAPVPLEVDVRATEPVAPWPARPAVRVEPAPIIEVTGSGASAPEQDHTIDVVGGGPINEVPERYDEALRRSLQGFADASLDWWRDSDLRVLQISYDFAASRPRSLVRRGRNRLTAIVHRPVETIDRDHPETQAEEDARALVRAITRRQGLPDPPWPS
jgi:hypothetical protein